MIYKLFRIWDIPNKEYVSLNMDSIESSDDYTAINLNNDVILEEYYKTINNIDLYSGDLIYAYDLWDNLIDYYILSYKDGIWYGSNDICDTNMSDILSEYTIKKIGEYNNIKKDGLVVHKNVCTECLCDNIYIHPKDNKTFFCNKCNSLY